MAKMKFGDETVNVVTRKEFPLKKAQKVLKGKTVAVLGYGIQGPAQSLNMRDNGIKVIVGQRHTPGKKNSSWERAIKDGWVPGKTLFSLEEAAQKGDIIMMLTSDASMKAVWKAVKQFVTPGKTLYFSHGFGYQYNDLTGIRPVEGVDVIMVAPKGSGTSVRRNFLNGAGINSSYAVGVNATGYAGETTLALGIAIGSGYLFPTTFKKEVTSDLVGERGILMGALAGVAQAQYDTLRANGHDPSEAFNESMEELTESLVPLVGEHGMAWMFGNCSATAQRGALDWSKRFYKAAKPVFKALYKSVATEAEARHVVKTTGRPDYKELLTKELQAMNDSEMWRAGEAVRALRPHEAVHAGAATAAGVRGRKVTK